MAFAKYPVSGSSGGDVTGPSSSVNNGVVLFNGTSGKVIKDLGVGSANQVLLTNGTTPSFGAITNAYIDSGAAIALSKLAALTASRALVSNGSGVISVSSVTDTELGYVSGVTSAIQTQLNTKANDSAVVHISGTETITGAKTFSSIIASSLTSNQFIAGNVTLSFTNSGTPTTITIPNVAPFATIPLLENAQTFTAQQSFSNNIVVQNRTIVLGTSQLITILGSTPASSRFVTIPEAGADSDFVLTAGSQTIGGSKTLSSAVTINPASNQVILSSGVNQLTLNSGTSAAARTYTVPDTGTTDTFAMLGGAQAFTALKTFNSGLAIAGGSAANNTIWVASNVLRQRGGTSGWAVDNTSGNAILSATDAGALSVGPTAGGVLHTIYGDVQLGTGALTRARINYENTTGQDRLLISHEIDSVVAYSIGTDSGNNFVLGTNSGVNTWGTKAVSIASTGAVTLGPSSGSSAITHKFQAGASSGANTIVRAQCNASDNFAGFFLGQSTDTTGMLGLIWDRNQARNYLYYNNNYQLRFASTTTDALTSPISSVAGFVETGSVTAAGAWTFGPTAGLNTYSNFYTPVIMRHTSGQSDSAVITFTEKDTTPGTPGSGIEMRVYMKADNFVIQYNDGGTVRYKYLGLTGTGVTWTHSTTAP